MGCGLCPLYLSNGFSNGQIKTGKLGIRETKNPKTGGQGSFALRKGGWTGTPQLLVYVTQPGSREKRLDRYALLR